MRLSLLLISLLFQICVFSQGIIQGLVTNERGEPVGNATVVLTPGDISQKTDAGGHFQFNNIAAGTFTVEVFYHSYESSKESVVNEGSDRISVNISLVQKAINYNDVIIIGYAKQLKRDVSSNIAKIQGKELTVNPGLSMDGAMQGKIPGLQIIQSSGISGAGAVMRLRGVSSLSAGGDPLYVIDGIPITQNNFLGIGLNGGGQQFNPIAFLNTADIESIEVLKDAAAAGIYGSRGASGVILITTKRKRKETKPSLTFIQTIATSSPTVKLSMVNNKEWMQLYQEAWENDGNSGRAILPGGIAWNNALGTNTNWIDQTTRLGLKTETNLALTYNSGKHWHHYNSFNLLNAGSYITGNNFGRVGGRFNIDGSWGAKSKVQLGLNLIQSNNHRQSQSWQGSLGSAYSVALPIYPQNWEFGFGTTGNPLLRRNNQNWNTQDLRVLTTFSYQTELAKEFFFDWRGAYDHLDMQDKLFIKPDFQAKDNVPVSSRKSESVYNGYKNDNVLSNATLSYTVRPNKKNDFTLLGGIEYQQSQSNAISGTVFGSAEAIKEEDIKNNPRIEEAWSFLSYFTRLNIRINAKYLLQAAYRIDGSSRFGENNRFGTFPTISGAYLVSEEPWMKNSLMFSFLKLRAGWGYTGNASIPNYIRWGVYGTPPDGRIYNGNPIVSPQNPSNPNLRWEKCRVADAGFELAMFKNKLYVEVSVYDRLTSDVLLDRRIPSSSGITNIAGEFRYFQNIGTIRNRGIEAYINTVNWDRRTADKIFTWRSKILYAQNDNTVVSLGPSAPDAIIGDGDTRVLPGNPVGVNYLVRFKRVDAADGLPIFLDASGHETKTWNLNNRVIAGNVQPKFTWSFQNSFEINRFTFSFLFYGVQGGTIYDDAIKNQLTTFSAWNMRTEVFDRWQKPGDNAKYPKLSLKPNTYGGLDNVSNYNTTQWLFDGTYTRLREISLSYQLKKFVEGSGGLFKSASITFRVFNIYLWTKYPGDPEVVKDQNSFAARNISPNVTYLTPPQERSFLATLKLDF